MFKVSPPHDRYTIASGGALAGRDCAPGHGSGISQLSLRSRVD
jgi:hypothetical protein